MIANPRLVGYSCSVRKKLIAVHDLRLRELLLCAAVLVGASACTAGDAPIGHDHGGDTVPVERGESAGADDSVWLTIGIDAADAVREAMATGGLAGRFHIEDRKAGVALLEMPGDYLPELSLLMHEEFRRCSGYIAHDSYDKALLALDRDRVDKAVNQKLITYTIDNNAVVNALTPTVLQQHLTATIDHLSTQYINRHHSTATGTSAAMWIRDTWQGFITASGRTDASVELVYHQSTNQPSVVMTIPGDWNVDEVVVIGGHLDSTVGGGVGPNTPAPGADDNASGIATVTEVARVMLGQGFYPDRTVKFMAYAAEEVGLRGSGEIADDYASQGIDVVGVLQLDMTNYQGSVHDIVLIGDYTNSAQNTFIGNLIDTYFSSLLWTTSNCGYACSDHASWTFAGYPASIPFEAPVGQHNPRIHTGSDTLAFSGGSGENAVKFARLALAYVAELAKGDFSDDWTPPPGATAALYPDTLGVYETRTYGPFPAMAGTGFDARLDSSGYADVYVRFGAPPTTTEYDCRPYSSDPTEVCSLTVPGSNTSVYVTVRGYMATYSLGIAYFDSTASATAGNPVRTAAGAR